MDCYPCRQTETDGPLPPREEVVRTAHWRVAHAFDTSLTGWLILLPHEHVTAFTDLGPAAMAEFGPLVHAASTALAEVTGCVKTYLMQFSEAAGFGHLHVHVVPRMPDAAPESLGPRCFVHLVVPPEEQVPEAERDRVALALRAAWPD